MFKYSGTRMCSHWFIIYMCTLLSEPVFLKIIKLLIPNTMHSVNSTNFFVIILSNMIVPQKLLSYPALFREQFIAFTSINFMFT